MVGGERASIKSVVHVVYTDISRKAFVVVGSSLLIYVVEKSEGLLDELIPRDEIITYA